MAATLGDERSAWWLQTTEESRWAVPLSPPLLDWAMELVQT